MVNRPATSTKKIAVIGLWHLGCVYAASLAKMGFDVVGIDFNNTVIEDLQKGVPPIFEPELKNIIRDQRDNLRFSNSINDLKDRDYVFITHDLEVDDNDVTNILDIVRIFEAVANKIGQDTTIITSSQLPIGTSRNLVDLLKNKGIKKPKVIYFPENLRLGTAFEAFLKPDRIIIGSDNYDVLDEFIGDFKFQCPIIKMNLESAEMVKHALNSYLATCISWSSEISDLAEKAGADMLDVVRALKTERRVSQYAPISPGLGFAGGTLGRDVQALRGLAARHKYNSKFFDAVLSVNRDRLSTLVDKIENVYPKLKGKKIGILGLTYKANTNTLRRSMSIELAVLLQKRGCLIRAYDPAIKGEMSPSPDIKICANYKELFKDLDMVVLMTDWKEFLDIDIKSLGKLMKERVIIDTKNFLNRAEYERNKFKYIGIGIK